MTSLTMALVSASVLIGILVISEFKHGAIEKHGDHFRVPSFYARFKQCD
ncbi:hypothetical protein [Mycobacterium uberis]|nr:hypothetical protein [Mycobacterium uberis]